MADTYPLLIYSATEVLEHFQNSLVVEPPDLRSLRDLDLQPLIYLTCRGKPQLQEKLSGHHRRCSSLLFLAMLQNRKKLVEAILATMVTLPQSRDNESVSKLNMYDCNLPPSQKDLNTVFMHPWLSLLTMSRTTCPGITELLINHGADVDVSEGEPLSTAVKDSDWGAVKLLLRHGARAEVKDKYSDLTLLSTVIRCSTPDITELFLNCGADANGSTLLAVSSPLLEALELPFDESRPIFELTEYCDHHDLGLSGDHIVDCSCRRNHECDLCCWAQCKQNIHALLAHGGDFNLKAGPRSISPFDYAVERYGKFVVGSLLERSLSTTNPLNDLLIYAAGKLNVEVVEYCLQKNPGGGAKMQALDAALVSEDHEISRWTTMPLFMSAGLACLHIVQLLRDANVDLSEISDNFRARVLDALMRWKDWYFCYEDCEMMTSGAAKLIAIRLSLELGGEMDDMNFDKIEGDCETALIAASATGQANLVRLLLEHGADPLHSSSLYGTALDIALSMGHTDVVKCLETASTAKTSGHGNLTP